jgi:hypothetical protein
VPIFADGFMVLRLTIDLHTANSSSCRSTTVSVTAVRRHLFVCGDCGLHVLTGGVFYSRSVHPVLPEYPFPEGNQRTYGYVLPSFIPRASRMN